MNGFTIGPAGRGGYPRIVTLPHNDADFRIARIELILLFIVGLGWMYVVLMMAVAEAGAADGTLLGALLTVLLYGVGPLALALYLLATPVRRRARRRGSVPSHSPAGAGEPQRHRSVPARPAPSGSAGDPDRGGHAPGDPIAAKRKEPRALLDGAPDTTVDR